MTPKKSIDWSDDHHKQMLVWQRQGMWREDTLEKLADWLGIEPGMNVLDVGCGLGYLGYTWWPYIGEGGRYTGLDTSAKLLKEAEKSAEVWSEGGTAEFIEGDAVNLPFEDNAFDWVMCQTLLMHLKEPERALSEMERVVRPGGLISCNEPDNLSAMLARPFHSGPEPPLEYMVLSRKVVFIKYLGRIALGKGDMAIGAKLPHLFTQMGLTDIDIRMNDRVRFLEPPYESEDMQTRMKEMKTWFLEDGGYQKVLAEDREEFLAGGGDAAEFDSLRDFADLTRQTIKDQLDRGEFYNLGAGPYFIAKGRKPSQM